MRYAVVLPVPGALAEDEPALRGHLLAAIEFESGHTVYPDTFDMTEHTIGPLRSREEDDLINKGVRFFRASAEIMEAS